MHFACFPIYIFGFSHTQCASNKKDFTFVKFTTQIFNSADESLKDETRLLLFRIGSLVTLHTFVFAHIRFMVKLIHSKEQSL